MSDKKLGPDLGPSLGYTPYVAPKVEPTPYQKLQAQLREANTGVQERLERDRRAAELRRLDAQTESVKAAIVKQEIDEFEREIMAQAPEHRLNYILSQLAESYFRIGDSEKANDILEWITEADARRNQNFKRGAYRHARSTKRRAQAELQTLEAKLRHELGDEVFEQQKADAERHKVNISPSPTNANANDALRTPDEDHRALLDYLESLEEGE